MKDLLLALVFVVGVVAVYVIGIYVGERRLATRVCAHRSPPQVAEYVGGEWQCVDDSGGPRTVAPFSGGGT